MEQSSKTTVISIHALREEGDLSGQNAPIMQGLFLSTPSARRATNYLNKFSRPLEISIHALREEGDMAKQIMPYLK